MRQSDRQQLRAKLFPECRPRASSAFRFARSWKFSTCRQLCLSPAQADTPAQSVRVIAPVEIGSKDKMNERRSAELLPPTVGFQSELNVQRWAPCSRKLSKLSVGRWVIAACNVQRPTSNVQRPTSNSAFDVVQSRIFRTSIRLGAELPRPSWLAKSM